MRREDLVLPTVLLVERDIPTAGLLLAGLIQEGHVAARVSSCDEAHRLLDSLPDVRLAVVDFGLPNGEFTALRDSLRLRHPRARLLAVVRGGDAHARAAEACGADAVVRYPCGLAALRAAVAALLPE
jgi:DNA-binding response OmpR family regulator